MSKEQNFIEKNINSPMWNYSADILFIIENSNSRKVNFEEKKYIISALNLRYQIVSGNDFTKYIGKSLSTLFPGRTESVLDLAISECLKQKAIFSFNVYTTFRFVEYVYSVSLSYCEEDGKTYVLGSAHDITDQVLVVHQYKTSLMEFNALFFTAPCFMMIVEKSDDDNLLITKANKAMSELYGKTTDSFIGHKLKEFSAPDIYSVMLKKYDEMTKLKKPKEQFWTTKKFGTEQTFYSTYVPVIADSKVVSIVIFTLDMTEKILLEKKTTRLMQEYEALFRVSPNAMWIVEKDEENEYILGRCNKNYLLYRNLKEDKTGEKYKYFLSKSDFDFIKKYYDEVFFTGKSTSFEVEIANQYQHQHYYIITISPVLIDGKVSRLIGTSVDRTENFKKMKRIEYLSFHDTLTAVFNRRYLEEYSTTVKYSDKSIVFCAIFDINGLKLINDTFGHLKGDFVLKTVASELLIKFPSCICSRWGGDEFVIIGENFSKKEISDKLKQFTNDISDKVESCPINVSFGYSFGVGENINLLERIRFAESNMNNQKFVSGNNLRHDYLETLKNVLFEKNYESRDHITKMEKLADRFAAWLNLDESEKISLKIVAALHDIGKVGVPQQILSKDTALTNDEFEEVKKHTLIGYKICLTSNLSEDISEGVKHHHEKYDGTGYPDNLKGKGIPKLARIITLIDSYEVMVRGRSYQDKVDYSKALQEIKRCSGTQFDPEFAEYFITMIESANLK